MRPQKRFLFELSREHATLPCAEALTCLNAEAPKYTVRDVQPDVLIVEMNATDAVIQTLSNRLAFTFLIDELVFSCPATLDDILREAAHHPLPREGSIAIRCKNRSSTLDSLQVIDRLGDVYTKDRKVALTNPDIELRALLTDTIAYVGMKKAEVNTSHFQQRRGHLRPFLSPVTMHPKIARALVNLSSVKKNQVLLDPFCGTGGILIEAGLLGVRVIGSDIEQKMIDGCRKNLEFYNLSQYQLYRVDIGGISQHVRSVDAVVTDFPYAKATTTKGEQLRQLYNRGFEHISALLKKNRRAVIGLSNEEMITLGEPYLSVVDVFPIRAHRSLTRYFVVYEK
jgi:tRNA (guanine10-N2)-dimethyltransferase